MKKYITISNLLFLVAIAAFFYSPSKIWIIRQLSFSPSVENVVEKDKITDYNWQLDGLNTSNINFSDLKGKVVFLNFWATWCPPCVAEMPSIQSLYNDYKNEVAFVFVTSDNWSDVEEFYKENGYDLPVYNSVKGYPKGLSSVTSIPKTFIIDKKGFIRLQKAGSANWNSDSFRKDLDHIIKE